MLQIVEFTVKIATRYECFHCFSICLNPITQSKGGCQNLSLVIQSTIVIRSDACEKYPQAVPHIIDSTETISPSSRGARHTF
jgi:hypothetical protein